METKTKMDFPAWLQNELDKRGWRPTELARRADLDDGIISRALSGARMPSNRSLEKISDALGIPIEEVFSRAGILPPSGMTEHDLWVNRMSRILLGLNSDLREMAEPLLNTLEQLQRDRDEQKKKGSKKQQ